MIGSAASAVQIVPEIVTRAGRVAVWQADCNGRDRSPGGRVVTQWPCSMSEFRARTAKPDVEAYEAAPLPRRAA